MKAIIGQSASRLLLIIFGVSLLLFNGCAIPVSQLQGTSGHVAWRVEDIRMHDDHQQNTRAWYYTLILRETKGVGTSFQHVKWMAHFSGRVIGSQEGRVTLRLEPFSELRITLFNGFIVRDWRSPPLASESLLISRTLSGVTDSGEPVKVAVSYSFESSAPIMSTAAKAMFHLNMGKTLIVQGKIKEAQVELDGVLALNPGSEIKSEATLGLGAVFLAQGQLAAAKAKVQEAETLRKNPEIKSAASLLLATILMLEGQPSAAEEKFKQAMLATDLSTRAGALLGLGGMRFSRLMQGYLTERYLRSFPQVTVPAVLTSSWLIDLMPRVFRPITMGEEWKAIKAMLEEAVRLTQERPVQVREAPLIWLATILVMEGRYREARRHFESLLSVPQPSAGEANGHLGLSFVALFEKDWSRAIAEADRAIALVLGPASGARAANAVLTAESISGLPIAQQAVALKAVALTVGAMDSIEAAERTRLVREAIQAFRMSLDLMESVRSKLDTQEARIAYLASPLMYDFVSTVLFKLSAANPGESFPVAEQFRARTLLELLAGKRGEGLKLPSPLRGEEERRLTKVSELEKVLTLATPRSDAPRSELGSAQRALNNFVGTLRRHKNPAVRAYAFLKYPNPPSVAEVQERLNSQEVLLAYKVTGTNTYLWVVRKDSRTRLIEIPLGFLRDLRTRVTAVLDSITRDPLAVFDPGPARALYGLLLKDALQDVPEGTPLIIVPDDALQQLPFEVLVSDDRDSSRPQYLGVKYPVTYYPSAGTLVVQRSVSGARDWTFPLLAVADPIAPEMKSGVGPSQVQSPSPVVATSHSYLDAAVTRGYGFGPIPATRREVRDIAGILRLTPTPPHILIGQATKAMLLNRKEGQELSRYRFIHLATHGILGTDVPGLDQPALILSGGPGLNEAARFLTMSEVFNLRLTAEMVVLSACQTGRGEVVPGEGVMGLTRAFLYAGTQSVVASLWNVADDATAVFMSRFYGYVLNDGLDKARALQKARMDFIKGSADGEVLAKRGIGGMGKLGEVPQSKALSQGVSISTSHPYFWAPFILVGDGLPQQVASVSVPDRLEVKEPSAVGSKTLSLAEKYRSARLFILKPQRGILDQAVLQLEDMVRNDPRLEGALTLLGKGYYQLGRYHHAMEILKRALAVDRTDEIAWLLLGLTQLRLGDDQKGIESIKGGLVLFNKVSKSGYRGFSNWDTKGLVRNAMRRAVLQVVREGLGGKEKTIESCELLLRSIDNEELTQLGERPVKGLADNPGR